MIPIRLSRFVVLTIVPIIFPCSARSEPALIVDGFIDSYVAHHQPEPKTRARPFTTQALYHDEPYLNLASGALTLNTDSVRVRGAAQWGSSVVANYSAEPSNSSQYLQEGYIGYKLAEDLWLDTGIFLSHLGPEGWLSKDNLTYTRSFIAEFSPYYETGIRLSTKLSEKLSAQFLLVRGWQNISQPEFGLINLYLSKITREN
jgi:hypothetical protein